MAVRGVPGRAPDSEKRERFARLIARGVGNAEACRVVGVHPKTGKRWRLGRTITSSGGRRRHYPPVITGRKAEISPRFLSEDERVRIADLHQAGLGVRAIAGQLGRSPSTVSRELRRNCEQGGSAYIYADGQAPAEQVSLSSGTVTYLGTDSLGSVRGTVNSGGALTGTTSYYAWGNPETAGGLTATTPFGYAGGYTDPDGLLYLINRFYNPQTGQFISVDPDLSETLQPYAYTDGDPVTDTDPSGLEDVLGDHATCKSYRW